MAEQKISIPGNNRPEEICEPCMGTVQCKAYYNDRWQTPIVGANIVMTDRDGNLFDGLKTQALKDFGCEDGQNIDPHRPLLGTCKQTGLRQGNVKIKLEPDPSAAAQAKQLEQQILQQIGVLEKYITNQMVPWQEKWQENPLKSLMIAAQRGTLNGANQWGKDQKDTWNSICHWFNETSSEILQKIEDGVEFLSTSDWQEIYNAFDGAIKNAGNAIYNGFNGLVYQIRVFIDLIKNFIDDGVQAIENVLDYLATQADKLPEELAKLITDLVKNSEEWAAGMIELIIKTGILPRLFSIITIIPLNFFVEATTTAAGYIIPEVLVGIILTVLAAFSAGAGAVALTARIAQYVNKLRIALKKRGGIVAIIAKILEEIKKISDLIIELIKNLIKSRKHEIEGYTRGKNDIIRDVFNRNAEGVPYKNIYPKSLSAQKKQAIMDQLDVTFARSDAIIRKAIDTGRIPDVAQNRIVLREGAAGLPNRYNGNGLNYAFKNHANSAKAAKKSQFTISDQEVINILKDKNVISSPVKIANASSNKVGGLSLVRQVDLSQHGYDAIGKLPQNPAFNGARTSKITIITDGFGNVKNVFPGYLDDI